MFNYDHTAISVKDLEKSLSFYKILGFKLYKEYHDDETDIVMLKLGQARLELFHNRDEEELPAHASDLNIDLKTVGVKHFCLNVEDVTAAKNWLVERDLVDEDVQIKSGRLGRAYFFIRDPNGIFIEIIEEKK